MSEYPTASQLELTQPGKRNWGENSSISDLRLVKSAISVGQKVICSDGKRKKLSDMAFVITFASGVMDES